MNKLVEIIKLIPDFSFDYKLIEEGIVLKQEKKNELIEFLVEIENPILVEQFNLIKKFSFEDLNFKVNFKVKSIITHAVLHNYLSWLAGINYDKYLFFQQVSLKKYRFEPLTNTLTFSFFNDFEKHEFLNFYDKLAEIFLEAFGIDNLKFEFKYCETYKEMKESKELQKQMIIKKMREKTIAQPIKEENFRNKLINLADLNLDMKNIFVQGEIYKIEIINNNKFNAFKYFIHDYKTSILCKYFIFKKEDYVENEKKLKLLNSFKVGDWLNIYGSVVADKYEYENYLKLTKIKLIPVPSNYTNEDLEVEKRVELCVHSKMSSFDGIIDLGEFFDLLKKFKHHSFAIADKSNVQIFPEIQKRAKIAGIKPIYGLEIDVCADKFISCLNVTKAYKLTDTFIIFDLETTGLNAECDDIIEFAGCKYSTKTGISECLQFFMKPKQELSQFTKDLTHISDLDVCQAISQEEGIKKILAYFEDYPIIAHNAINFDYLFILKKANQFNLKLETNLVVDTLFLSRALYSNNKFHSLGKLAKSLKVIYDASIAHRALYDVEVLTSIWAIMINDLKLDHGIETSDQINNLVSEIMINRYPFNIVYLYAKNQLGLKKLYELVSIAHTKEFKTRPTLNWEIINKNRENLIVCNNPIDGKMFKIALNHPSNQLTNEIKQFDYIFVAPFTCFLHEENETLTKKIIEETTNKIIQRASELNKKCIAVSSPYYLKKIDKEFHEVYRYAKQISAKRHRYWRAKVAPDLFFKSTSELLKDFNFLINKNLIKEIVIKNSNLFANEISDQVFPIQSKLFVPTIKNVDKLLINEMEKNILTIYGQEINPIIRERIDRELKSILEHGFSVIYWISHLLVKKSLEDGYVVGSRGSVGSSLVATMLKITEVNPLSPHYICLKCHYHEFSNLTDDGYDLPNKICPKCQNILVGEGHQIPFETFLGFKGDKTPDIDLNFSGEYQNVAHNFIKKMFGEAYSFRAGTISTVAEKTSYGYVKAYFDEIYKPWINNSTINLYVKKCLNIKRTTGQHPGGILIVPANMSIYDFTPYNFPADDLKSEWYTTHFAFEYLHENLLKFDILGHDNPTLLKKLEMLTGIKQDSIPNHDQQIIELFNSVKPLKFIHPEIVINPKGALALPEFGTKFVSEMLKQTKPQSFADLIRISGLSHGTDVYIGNAKTYMKNNGLELADVIGCRDDIMIYLMEKGLPNSDCFKIMEDVRKGKGLSVKYKELMIEYHVPAWYIESCEKIKYMFPKAHATAYVQHAWKFAWYKIYYPKEFYATYLANRLENFDVGILTTCWNDISTNLERLKKIAANVKLAKTLKKKELELINLSEVVLEMNARGYLISKPDIYKSKALDFVIEDNKLIIPFVAIEGLGSNTALTIFEEAQKGDFLSIEDIYLRTKINKSSLQILRDLGVLDNFDETNQLTLF